MAGSREGFKALKDLQRPSVLATVVGGENLGARWLVDEVGPDYLAGIRQVQATGEACLVSDESGGGPVEILLEPITPGRLAPWIHFCSQQLERGKRCALVTVVAIEGEAMPYGLGDRFAYDDQSHHGLLPIDAGLSVLLTRATARALAGNEPYRERFAVPGGTLALLIEPLEP